MMSGPKHSTVAVVRRIVNRLQEISDATSATSKKGLPRPSPPSLPSPYNRVKLNSMSLRVRLRFATRSPPAPRNLASNSPFASPFSVRYTTPSRTRGRRRRSDRSPAKGRRRRRRHGYKWSSSPQPPTTPTSESSIK